MTQATRAQQATQPRDAQYNAADSRQVAERQERAKARMTLETAGLSTIMSTAEGRAYMHSVLERCGIFRPSFTGNSETFFKEGERNVGLMIMADVMRGQHEDHYLTMMREARDRGSAGFRPRAVKSEEGDS